MRILTQSFELGEGGSGLGRVVKEVADRSRRNGHQFYHISSLTQKGSGIFPAKLIKSFGGVGIIAYWRKALAMATKTMDFDLVWMHQPLILGRPRVDSPVVA